MMAISWSAVLSLLLLGCTSDVAASRQHLAADCVAIDVGGLTVMDGETFIDGFVRESGASNKEIMITVNDPSGVRLRSLSATIEYETDEPDAVAKVSKRGEQYSLAFRPVGASYRSQAVLRIVAYDDNGSVYAKFYKFVVPARNYLSVLEPRRQRPWWGSTLKGVETNPCMLVAPTKD